MNGGDRVVGIVGLGYVGLPLAISFAESGLEVLGLEANASRVAELQAGLLPDRRCHRRPTGGGARRRPPHRGSRIRPSSHLRRRVRVRADAHHRAKDPDLGPVLGRGAMIGDGLAPAS